MLEGRQFVNRKQDLNPGLFNSPNNCSSPGRLFCDCPGLQCRQAVLPPGGTPLLNAGLSEASWRVLKLVLQNQNVALTPLR